MPGERPHVRRLVMKDGREALIRPVVMEDAPALLEETRAVHAAGIGVVRDPSELAKTLEEYREQLKEWIEGNRSGFKGCRLIAIIDETDRQVGRAVGAAQLKRMAPLRVRHNAEFGISVHPDFQGQGIGRALMEGLIDWAKHGEGRGITRLALNVFADNERAIALYTSLGFQIVGRRHKCIRYQDGSYTDDYEMELLLEP